MSPIPWAAILTHAPAIVAAAQRLFVTTQPNKTDQRQQSIEARLDRLETASADSARLLQEMAEQLQRLTTAQEDTRRRVRQALILAALATALGAVALVLVVTR